MNAKPAASTAPAEAAAGGLAAARADYRKNFFDPYAHMRLAETLYRSGRVVDAFYILEEARGLFPESTFNFAHHFVIIGKGRGGWPGREPFDPSPAHEAHLKRQAQADPKDWEALSYLAHIEGSRGNLSAAEAQINKVLEIAPRKPGALAFKAMLNIRKKNLAEALSLFDQAASQELDSPDGRSATEFMGQLARSPDSKEMGALRIQAFNSLQRIAQKYPDDTQTFIALAFVYWARGEMPQVRALVKQALERNPKHAGAATIQGALFIQDKQVDPAIAWLKKAAEADPDNQYALEKLSQLYRKEKHDPGGALPYYIALHHLNPHYYDWEYAESRIKEELNQKRTAALSAARTPEQLAPFFSSEDGSLRAEACLRAADFKSPSLVAPLMGLLDDDVGSVTQNADYALFQTGKANPAALLDVREKMLNSTRIFVRGMALGLYADLTPAETLPIILARLKDSEPYVRFRASSALKHYYAGNLDAKQALDAYRIAEKNPKLLAAYQYLDGEEAKRTSEKEQGQKFLAEMSRKDPASGAVLKASVFLAAKDYAGAIKQYRKALELNRKKKTLDKGMLEAVYSGLGDAYLFSNHPRSASAALEQTVKLSKAATRPHVLYNLACAYSMSGQLKKAGQALRSCLTASRKERGTLNHFLNLAKTDSQLKKLRTSRDFKKIIAPFKKKAA
ncbi:MAG: tetratricopeptide repeat protein [Elusimicrobia bacterium]|nr:tetratricopeptide repeat protein [Elusimicrobiota bacterium]